jgi:hypothetical protein
MPDIVRCLVDARRSVEAFGLAREDERKMAERLAITMLEDRRALRARAQ